MPPGSLLVLADHPRMYRIVVDQETEEQIDALSYEALAPLAELLDVLTIAPWNGDPINNSNPGVRCGCGPSASRASSPA